MTTNYMAGIGVRCVLLCVLVLSVTGCMTQIYLQFHKDRPQEVQDALLAARVCNGMTPREVDLVWGPPQEKQKLVVGRQTVEMWNYTKTSEGGSVSVHDLDVPMASVMFSNSPSGLIVFEWVRYEEEVAATGKPPAKEASVKNSAGATQKPKVILPAVTPGVDLSKWPKMVISGVIVTAKSGGVVMNGNFVSVGQSLEGVKLEAVAESTAYLTYKGETVMARKGDTIGGTGSGGGLFRKKK